MRNLRCALWALENCSWPERYISREYRKLDDKLNTCLCVALLLQAWLSIPPKILPIRSHFRRKLHLFDFSRRKARDKSGVASQSTSWLHQLVDTPRRLHVYASQSSFRHGGWAARPAAGHKIAAGKRKKTCHMTCLFLTGSYLSSQAASSQVLSTYKGLTTVFGMGTGGSP